MKKMTKAKWVLWLLILALMIPLQAMAAGKTVREGTVSGLVMMPGGQMAGYAHVLIESVEHPELSYHLPYGVTTDSRGYFVLENIPMGHLRVSAQPQEQSSQAGNSVVTVYQFDENGFTAEGRNTPDKQLIISLSRPMFAVTLRMPDGTPVENGWVVDESGIIYSAPTGKKIYISGLAPGEHTLWYKGWSRDQTYITEKIRTVTVPEHGQPFTEITYTAGSVPMVHISGRIKSEDGLTGPATGIRVSLAQKTMGGGFRETVSKVVEFNGQSADYDFTVRAGDYYVAFVDTGTDNQCYASCYIGKEGITETSLMPSVNGIMNFSENTVLPDTVLHRAVVLPYEICVQGSSQLTGPLSVVINLMSGEGTVSDLACIEPGKGSYTGKITVPLRMAGELTVMPVVNYGLPEWLNMPDMQKVFLRKERNEKVTLTFSQVQLMVIHDQNKNLTGNNRWIDLYKEDKLITSEQLGFRSGLVAAVFKGLEPGYYRAVMTGFHEGNGKDPEQGSISVYIQPGPGVTRVHIQELPRVRLTGKIRLADGEKAPVGGLRVRLSLYGITGAKSAGSHAGLEDEAVVVIPEGKNEAEYTLSILPGAVVLMADLEVKGNHYLTHYSVSALGPGHSEMMDAALKPIIVRNFTNMEDIVLTPVRGINVHVLLPEKFVMAGKADMIMHAWCGNNTPEKTDDFGTEIRYQISQDNRDITVTIPWPDTLKGKAYLNTYVSGPETDLPPVLEVEQGRWFSPEHEEEREQTIEFRPVSLGAYASYMEDMEGHWAKNEATFLDSKAILTGWDGLFHPEVPVTRGDAVLALVRALGLERDGRGEVIYEDVPENSRYFSAVTQARKLGISMGYGDVFRPESPLTRQEAMVLVANVMKMLKLETPVTGRSFTDRQSVAAWAEESVDICTSAGIIEGWDGAIHPDEILTRAQMAMVVAKILKRCNLLQ